MVRISSASTALLLAASALTVSEAVLEYKRPAGARRGILGSGMVRYTITVILVGVLLSSLDRSVSQNTTCSGSLDWLGDGFCDSENNNLACDFDGGDCCACTCVDRFEYGCGENEYDCLDPACPDEDRSPYPNCTVPFGWRGDGWCDAGNNNLACDFDGGDCCACTCVDGLLYSCGLVGFDCRNEACADPAIAIEFPTCTGNLLGLGDGSCTAENNNDACGYDAGDCCLCTCRGRACGLTGFDCSDPSAGDEIYDCKPPPHTSIPCPADGKTLWIVEDSAQARALAEAVNCSDGAFEVLWKGNVVVDETIFVIDGTVLNVTGAGLISSMDGNSTTRLVAVVNATAHFTGVNMTNGVGVVGGAVAAARSNLTFDRTLFSGNSATGHGGAMHISDGCIVSFVGQNEFCGNAATIDGGALFLSDSSCSGEDMSFLNNTASSNGGAVSVTEHAILFWSGSAIFHGNRAGGAGGAVFSEHGSTTVWSTVALFQSNIAEGSGGALALHDGSSASWLGDTKFYKNRARHHAGALLVRVASQVSWNATTNFSSNRAAFSGGAMRVTQTSNAFCAGSTVYVENSADQGGAVVASHGSNFTSGGDTVFSSNTAEHDGGAVIVINDSIAAWNGDTEFSRNSAGDGGAVFADDESYLSFEDRTVFRGNLAVAADTPGRLRGGGALDVRHSTLVLSGDSLFADNQALAVGGAVSAIAATVIMTGRSSFLNNSVETLGGAVFFSTSDGVVDGNITFRDNAAFMGGAVDATGSSVVEWGGVAEFSNNSAFIGGALAVRDSSVVSFDGTMTLDQNLATVNESGAGGAISVINNARVSWSGQASFLHNSAGAFGGAVHVLNGSAVYWSGKALFLGCSADYGGALFVQSESTAEWSGPTEFIFNRAAINGGAVGSHSGDGGETSRGITILINGSTTVANNTAGATGGGFGLNGKLSIAFQSADVIFIGNSADVAGGAVSVSGISNGPVFSAVRFVGNFAGAGGAAFITGSGNEDIGNVVTTSLSATKFDECLFVDNRATATGGAIESVAGQDYISDSVFVGNTAGVGGALRLAGMVGLDYCTFVNNTSDEGEGPAINNIGVSSVIKHSTFIGNVFNCEEGAYLGFNESGNVFDVACKGCGASCEGCTFGESPVVPICAQTMEHSTSSGGTTTLTTVSINRGFWRATSDSEDVLPCYREEACHGGVTGSPEYCRIGYEGPYCSVCSDGYAKSFGFACERCSDQTGGIMLTAVVAVIVLVGAAAVGSFTMSSERERGGRGNIELVARFIPLQTIKTVIVALQIVTQFTEIANVTYPHVYQRFLDTVNVVNFDLGWMAQLSVGCLFDVGIHGRLLVATIGPLIAVVLLGFTYVVAAHRSRGSVEVLGLIRHRHMSMVLLVTFLVYSSVSSILFQMFACDDLDDGKKYIRADYRVECDSSKHRAFQVYAGFMILLYTVGIPTLYTYLLVPNREALKVEGGRGDSLSAQSVSNLWKPYRPSVFYYEVIECARRVLLTGTVVFIYPNTSAQIAVTLMIAFVFAMLSEGLAPFSSRWDTWISRMGHVVVYVSMYVALLLKVDVSSERSYSQKVFEAVLVAAHLGMILAIVVETGVLICSLRETVREVASPRSRVTKLPFTRDNVPIAQNR